MRSHLIFGREVNNNTRQQRDIVELNRILRATRSLQVRFVAVLAFVKMTFKSLAKGQPLTFKINHQSAATLDRSYPGRPILEFISEKKHKVWLKAHSARQSYGLQSCRMKTGQRCFASSTRF